MADALLSMPLQIALEKLAQVMGEQIGLYAGAARELKKIRNTFQSIQAYLRDAESKQVDDESVRLWLSNLKGIAHDIEDVLDEWQISGLQNDGSDDDVDGDKVRTCFPSPFACFNRSASRYKIARQIKEIRDNLDQIAEERRLFNFTINSGEATPVSSRPQTGALIEESGIIGRDQDKETVISRLVSGSSSGGADGQQVHVTAIVGIGGLGKTTLAQQIYNDVKVKDHFNPALYFVCVSEIFDVIRLIKAILEQVKGTSTFVSELPSLQRELLQSLGGKRFLLVLDDVWNDDAEKWEPLRLSLRSGAYGSKILVTTRSEKVANVMNAAYIHQLQGLSDELSWTLFSSRAFAGRTAEEYSELESVGRKIVSKCRGVPLSIKVMGSAMKSKRTRADWQNVLDSTMWSLPQVTDKILPALMLSYYNLPPYLKQCFAYCSIFRKDTRMDKDELVKLWVAQGFIRPQGNREKEDIGEEYFNDLVECSMLQQVHFPGWTEFQMHDLLHDLAEFITKDERFIFTGESSYTQCPVNVRHASLFLNRDNPSIPIPSFQAKKLRTLFVHRLDEIGTVLDDLFHQARFLRALLLRGCEIKMLTETIGKLKHLRYLDLSRSKIVELPNAFEKMQQLSYLDLSRSDIVELPESVSHLVKLHTLNLEYCRQLKKLPRGIGRMVSLRHLQIGRTDSLECLPEGLGKISCLRSLCKFIVGGEGGCRIDELQQLNSLHGTLEIKHLERVSSKEEAEKAELWTKSHLRKLVFRRSSGGDKEIVISGRTDAEKERMENVLDGLRPHPNLEELELRCNSSSSKVKLPSWMEDSSFLKLTDLCLYGFNHCEENLLGLGKLPSLKYLELREVGVRKMGDEFYHGMSSNDVVGKRRGVAFPKLERLILREMYKLEDWELTWEADDVPAVMPSLRQLVIIGCPELQLLPPHLAYAPLAELTIKKCGRIKGVRCSSFPLLEDFTLVDSSEFFSSCLPDLPNLKKFKIDKLRNETLPIEGWERLVTLQVLEISNCNELKCLPDGLGQHKKLKSLTIEGAEALTCLPDTLEQLESLEELIISDCQKLVWLPHSLQQLQKLRYLSILSAKALTCLPDSLGQLESLEQLIIRGCQKLVSLPHSLRQLQKLSYISIQGAKALTCLPDSLGQLESLEHLRIRGCQKLVSLPHSLQQLQKLKYLEIKDAEALTYLPDALGQLESLEELMISGCQKLVWLPHSLRQLQKLRYLSIQGAKALACLPDSLGQLESLEHLTICSCQKLVSLPHSLRQLHKLRYLSIQGAKAFTCLPDSLGQLESLEQLTIRGCQKLVSLPHSLGQLQKLKYFEINDAEALTHLPDSLGQLESLQELTISGCKKLVSLPHLLRQLQNLRYLSILGAKALTCLPDSLGQLESLEQLIIRGCNKLASLPHSLRQLQKLRYLSIRGAKALTCLPESLGQLESLEQLTIRGCKKLVSLPHSLQQLQKLRHLSILSAKALACLPDWVGQLESLEQLTIRGCQKLVSLPHMLRQLQKLRYLSIQGAKALACLPDSLGQLESLEQLTVRGCEKLVSLPHSLGQLHKLRYLSIRGAKALTCLPDSLGQLESLEQLTIRGCEKLVSLPDSLRQLQKLRNLTIQGAKALTYLPNSLGQLESLEQLAIRGCQNLVSLPHSLQQLQKLSCLSIHGAKALTSLPDSLGQLESLEQLTIRGCQKLVSLPHSLRQLQKLRYLSIQGAKALTCLPNSLGQLKSLEHLAIRGCQKMVSLSHSLGELQKLKCLEIKGVEALTCLPDSLRQLESLEEIIISECQNLVSLLHSLRELQKLRYLSILSSKALTCLPDSLGQLESLEQLTVRGCHKLVSLPHSFGQLKKLKSLRISNCEALESLPHALQDLSLLQALYISECPQLSERCKKEEGEDWPKISHIPKIFIDGCRVIK